MNDPKIEMYFGGLCGVALVAFLLMFANFSESKTYKSRVKQLNQQLKTAREQQQTAIARFEELELKYKTAIRTIEELRTSNQKSAIELSKLAGNIESATSRAAISAKLITECNRILESIEKRN